LNKIALFIIKLYQKYLSPRKGYCCAYGSLYNNGSCSQRVSNIISENGLISGWSQIKNQFVMCSEAYEVIQEKNRKKAKKKKDEIDWCSPVDACEVIRCIPVPRRWCKGKSNEGDCDLPCDCSPF